MGASGVSLSKRTQLRSRLIGRRRKRGFTLVETLAAFIIAVVSLAVVYQAVATGIAGGLRARDAAHEALVAPSILDQLGVSILLVSGDNQAVPEYDGWTYSAEVAPPLFGEPSRGLVLYRVELRNTKSGTTFVTNRLARAP